MVPSEAQIGFRGKPTRKKARIAVALGERGEGLGNRVAMCSMLDAEGQTQILLRLHSNSHTLGHVLLRVSPVGLSCVASGLCGSLSFGVFSTQGRPR